MELYGDRTDKRMKNMASIKVEVKQTHIDSATSSIFECPIALAIKDVVGERAAVGLETFSFSNFRGYLPPEARKFVSDFDSNREVEPFAFDADYAEKSIW